MTNFIPIFPLNIVVYPNEHLNLHIFEPRYKQMISECHTLKKSFGIPSIIDEHINEYGTLMEIESIEKIYDNGEMDIRTKGTMVFRILEMIPQVPDKLYSGAIVNYPDNNDNGDSRLMQKVISGIRELHHILSISKSFSKPDEVLSAYDVAHHAGLTLREEYEMLELMQELQRQEYLKRHLNKVIPLMAEIENLKERVKLNGHFRNLSAENF